MRKSAQKAKKRLDYPDETEGSRLGTEVRRRGNKLSPEERRFHFEQGMAMIYGGEQATKRTGAGHKSGARSR